MPNEWRRSILVPIFKNKGDIQSYTNYRGIKLMSHIMKLWERVIEHRLRKLTIVSKNQFCFMPGGNFLDKTTYEETSGTEEWPTYDIYWFRESI
jgi:hypothetical protein